MYERLSIRELFPYHVPFNRSTHWFDIDGDWHKISTWCIANFGHRWEYMDGRFMFESQKDQAWFILKWK